MIKRTETSWIFGMLPNILSLFRIACVPFLFFFLLFDIQIISIFLYIFSTLSDFFDGYCARKLHQCSKLGGYLDVFGDFFLIFFSIFAFVLKGSYPSWILLLLILMLLQFFLTSRKKRIMLYDPLGKHYGTFLMAIILISLFDIHSLLSNIMSMAVLSYTFLCLSTRAYFLRKNNKLIIEKKDLDERRRKHEILFFYNFHGKIKIENLRK